MEEKKYSLKTILDNVNNYLEETEETIFPCSTAIAICLDITKEEALDMLIKFRRELGEKEK